MNLFAMILALQAAATPPADGANGQPDVLRLVSAASVERIALPRLTGSVTLEVAPLDKLVTLHLPKDSIVVGGRIASALGALCGKISIKSDRVELECRTRRIDAAITREGGQSYLELYELRGLPWRAGIDGPPLIPYTPELVGLGGPCPGTTPAGQGECAFADEHWLEAAERFREALATSERPMAAVRLGDLALLSGDPATAIGWYQRAGSVGTFGRVANARLCELDASCFRARPTLDPQPGKLPQPLRNDLLLRRARALAYLGEFGRSLKVLLENLTDHQDRTLCLGSALPLCRRIVLTALRSKHGPDSELALEVFLELPDRHKGPFAVDVAEAAAEASSRLGAPVFGANLLAIMVPDLATDALSDHLARAAELYLAGKDGVRARVILEFAESRIPQSLGSSRWANVRKGLLVQDLAEAAARRVRPGELSPSERIAAALAAAQAASNKVRALLNDIEGAAPELAAAPAPAPASQVPAAPPEEAKP